MKIKKPLDGEHRTIEKFLWLPLRLNGIWIWLENVKIHQIYLYTLGGWKWCNTKLD